MCRLPNGGGGGTLHAKALFTKSPCGSRVLVSVAAMCAAAILGVPSKCQAQYPENLHSYTVNVGAGIAPLSGTDGGSLGLGRSLQAGAGIALTSRPKEKPSKPDKYQPIPPRRWNIFLTGNFIFAQSTLDSAAVEQAIIMNPQDTQILSATSGKGKFYSTTLDPTLRINATNRVNVYLLAGFGWFRRTLDFTGVSFQGTALQPTNPTVFGISANSGGVDAGGGMDIGLTGRGGGLKLYFEARVLHGLAINNGTTVIPLSVGIRW